MFKNKKKYNLDAYVPLRGKKEIVSLSLWEKNSKLNFINIRDAQFENELEELDDEKRQITKRYIFKKALFFNLSFRKRYTFVNDRQRPTITRYY